MLYSHYFSAVNLFRRKKAAKLQVKKFYPRECKYCTSYIYKVVFMKPDTRLLQVLNCITMSKNGIYPDRI